MNLYAYVGIKIQYTILFVQNTVFKIYMDLNPNICICIHFHTYVIDIKIKIYIYKLIWFRTGHQSVFCESIEGFRARFASQLVQFGASERISRVNWFSSGLQSAFRESIGSVRGFKARFANHLIQNGFSVLNQMTREMHFEAPFWVSYSHQSPGHTRK